MSARLEEILNDKHDKEEFRLYLTNIKSQAPFLFISHVKELEDNYNRRMKNIFDWFLTSNGPFTLNLSHDEKIEIEKLRADGKLQDKLELCKRLSDGQKLSLAENLTSFERERRGVRKVKSADMVPLSHPLITPDKKTKPLISPPLNKKNSSNHKNTPPASPKLTTKSTKHKVVRVGSDGDERFSSESAYEKLSFPEGTNQVEWINASNKF